MRGGIYHQSKHQTSGNHMRLISRHKPKKKKKKKKKNTAVRLALVSPGVGALLQTFFARKVLMTDDLPATKAKG